MLNPKRVAEFVLGYLREHPEELLVALLNAVRLRFGVPLDGLRWLTHELPMPPKAPKNIEIESVPPALRLSASVDAMGTPLRASASIRIDSVDAVPGSVQITLVLQDVKLALEADVETPVAMLIKSGALDLSKPGNLVNFLPKRPPFLLSAEGDRITIDLLKVPSLAKNKKLAKLLRVLTPIIAIRAIETDAKHLYVALKPSPLGVVQSFDAIRTGA